MVKVHTIGMIEHNAKSFPNYKAHTDMVNGALVGMGDGVTAAPAAGKKLYVVINTQVGDNLYADPYPIVKDDLVNLFDLSVWDGQELDVTEENIVYGSGEDYSSLTMGTELTFDADTFKFKKGTAAAGDISFTVTKKIGNATNGVVVKIAVKE